MQLVPISQKVLIFNKDGQFLVLLRGKTAPSKPLRWDLPGGDLELNEDPIESMVRETKEESGLEVEQLRPFDVEAHINNKGVYWVTIGYIAKTSNSKVKISWEHDEYKWVNLAEFLKLESIPKIVRFVKKHYINQN